jgi:type IV secretory pathway VirB4 component
MINLPFLTKKQPAGAGEPAPAGSQVPVQPAVNLSIGFTSIQDVIAPSAIEVDFNHLQVGQAFFRTLFVAGYPRFVNANWLSPLINFDHTLDISMYIYPTTGRDIIENLKRKIGEMEAELQTDTEKGKIVNIDTKVKLEDAKHLQEQLAKGAERFFQLGLYINIPASSKKELDRVTKQVQSTLGSLMIISKIASLQMEDAFKTTLPYGFDRLMINRNMDTTSLATTFPFASSELTANEGILFGINQHSGSLIIFDRFSLENANMVVFAKSGAGKSFFTKLEVLRSMMFDTEVIIIDPEDEYRTLCQSVDGEYISFSSHSSSKINPFDLSQVYEEGVDELGLKILSLHNLLAIIMGQLSPIEEALLDRALVLTYKQKGITPDPLSQRKEPPLMEDLYKTLVGMEQKEALTLAARMEKFIKGSLRGIFDQQSTVELANQLTVFSTKELENELRPVAMYIILDYVWTKIKKDLKKRLLVVDEAWYLMKYPDSAAFLYSMAKRSRKYFLGLTTITQDTEDFLASNYGKAIVTNSSIQILMKQSTAAIDRVGEVFFLSQGEKNLLISAGIGEGLFFAGTNHVAMKVVASREEYDLITSKPEDILKKRATVLPTANPVLY